MSLRVAARVGAGTAALALLVTLGDLTLGHDGEAAPAAATTAFRAPLRGASVVCPDVHGVPPYGATRVAAASLPPGGHPVGGQVRRAAVAESATPRPLTSTAGRVAVTEVGGVGGPEQVTAAGTIASGLEVEQLTRLSGGVVRGIADARCLTPAADWWFVGPSGKLDVHDALHLVNTDDLTALVDVELWGPRGPVSSPNAQGLQVAPHGRLVVHVDRLAPDADYLALHVVARTGRVAAAVFDQRQHGGVPDGIDWIAPTTPPARSLLVPGFMPGDGSRRLLIAAPGDADATVKLRVLGPDGGFVPSGLDALAVPAGTVRQIDLTGPLGRAAAAVSITSDTPVTAAGRQQDRSAHTGFADIAWTVATPAINGPALVVDNRVNNGNTSHLRLSAPTRDAVVTVTSLPPAPAARVRVRVPAGQTVSVDVARLLPAPALTGGVVVAPDPGSGPVYGTRDMFEDGAHGPLTSLLPLAGVTQLVPLPAVEPDLSAGVG